MQIILNTFNFIEQTTQEDLNDTEDPLSESMNRLTVEETTSNCN